MNVVIIDRVHGMKQAVDIYILKLIVNSAQSYVVVFCYRGDI